jgi:hypothetical protein
MRKTAAALIMALLIIAVAGTFLVNLGKANPYLRDWKVDGEIPVPEGTKLPVVTISNPQNNSYHASKNLLLNFSAVIEKSGNISLGFSELYYIGSWQNERTDFDMNTLWVKNNYSYPSEFSINLTDVPEGYHWLEVCAVATAFAYETRHELDGIYYTTYYVRYKTISSSTANFTIDTTAPNILSVSMENKTYDKASIPFVLVTNEPVSQVLYSLDGLDNVAISGNSTLTDLSAGNHTVTVYARDLAGNFGASETLTFTVAEPESFPSVPVVAVSALSIAAVTAAGLIFTRRRRRKEAQQA